MNRVNVTLTANIDQPCQTGPSKFFRIVSVPTGATLTGSIENASEPGVEIPLSATTWYEAKGDAEGLYDLRIKSSVSGVVTILFSNNEVLRDNDIAIPSLSGGPLPVSEKPFTSVSLNTLNASAGALSSVGLCPTSATKFRALVSVDAGAAGPIWLTNIDAPYTGLEIMPGETKEIGTYFGSSAGFYYTTIRNPHLVAVSVGVYCEYF